VIRESASHAESVGGAVRSASFRFQGADDFRRRAGGPGLTHAPNRQVLSEIGANLAGKEDEVAGGEGIRQGISIMTAADVIHQLQSLSPDEVAKVRDWLSEREDDSPELLAAVDEGLRSLAEKGARVVTRDELEQKVRRWAGRSQ
jgi:hypothetical protein